jgi:hypothetical protein
MDAEVRDRRDGQVELQGAPVGAIVEGDEHAKLGAGVQQAWPCGILTHHARGLIGGNAVGAVREALP